LSEINKPYQGDEGSGVFGAGGDRDRAVLRDCNRQQHGSAADLTVLDIFTGTSAAVDHQLHALAAAGAVYTSVLQQFHGRA
jgi:hypothetical protein